MRFEDFKLERFFAEWEFTARWMLSSSDPESMTLQELLTYAQPALLEEWNDLHLGYTESAGSPALRRAVSARTDSLGEDDLVVTAAPEEAIFLVCNAVLGAGDNMVGITPAYQSSYSIPRAIGASTTLVPLREDDGWRLDVSALAAGVRPETKLIYINFPHNPTGAVLGPEEVQALLDLLDRTGATLLSDEVYRGLEFDPADRTPPMADLHPRAISIGGLSKAYGLPGLRLGWVLSQDRGLLDRIVAAKDYTTICNSAPSEALATIAVQATDALVQRSRERIVANTVIADAFVARQAEFVSWVRPRGGSTAFPRLAESVPVEDLSRDLVRKRSALLVPARMFDHKGNNFRLGLGRANFPQALERLDHYLSDLG